MSLSECFVGRGEPGPGPPRWATKGVGLQTEDQEEEQVLVLGAEGGAATLYATADGTTLIEGPDGTHTLLANAQVGGCWPRTLCS